MIVFIISYPLLFSISNPSLLILVIIIVWGIFMLTKREYSIMFCFLGYMYPFTTSNPTNFSSTISFTILFVFLLILSCVFMKIWLVKYKLNTTLTKLIWLFILYQLLVSIIPNLINGELSLQVLLIEKDQFLGILLFFPGYYLGVNYFRNTVIFLITFGLLYSIFYYLVLYNIFSFINISSSYVITGAEKVMRYGLDIKQVVKIFIYAIPVAFLFKTNLKIIILAIGISCYLFLLFSFVRNEIIYSTLGILLSAFIIFKYRLKNRIYFFRFLFFFIALIIIGLSLISNVLTEFNLNSAITETISASKSSSSFFSLSHRFDVILPNHLSLLFSSFQNFFFGEGFSDIFRENVLTKEDLGIWDMPLTGSLARFGVIGFLIYIAIYVQIFKEIFIFLKLLKARSVSRIKNPILTEYAFLIAISSYLITSMIFRTFYITWELTVRMVMVEYFFLIGLFIAVVHKVRFNSLSEINTNKLDIMEKSDKSWK